MSAHKFFKVCNTNKSSNLIFKTDQDYNVFLSYIKEYLNPPGNPQKYKKTFTVNGKRFQGVPHLPKNYFGKIELLEYVLEKNGFKLLFKEIETGSITSFLKSLLTRYSIYFNKKYNHHGSVFENSSKIYNLEDKNEFINEYINTIHKPSKYLAIHQRIPEIAFTFFIFMILFFLGLNKVNKTNNISLNVAGAKTESVHKEIIIKTIKIELPLPTIGFIERDDQ